MINRGFNAGRFQLAQSLCRPGLQHILNIKPNPMKIQSYKEFNEIEQRIIDLIRRIPLDALLIGIRGSASKFEPFVRAGISLFGIRFCSAGPKIEKAQAIRQKALENIAHLVTLYLLADPITFDQDERNEFSYSNPVFTLLRVVGHQFPFAISNFGHHARPLMLYAKIPNTLKEKCPKYTFDIQSAFFDLNGFSICDFIDVCFIMYSVAIKNSHFTRAYIENSREKLNVPDENTVSKILDSIAGDPEKLSTCYYKFRNDNRTYRMYDLNPLFLFPVVRPWSHNSRVPHEKDRMIVPVPNLINYRMSTGVYYQLFNEYKSKFSDSFGIVFENYVGWILEESVTEKKIIHEKTIRKNYPEKFGPVPDFVILEDKSAVLIECKATKFTRGALVTGKEDSIIDSLKQLIKGLKQLSKFRNACLKKHPSLHIFHKYKTLKSVLLTVEPLYLINSILFRAFVTEELLKEGIPEFEWTILSIDELEAFQAHIKAGQSLSAILGRLKTENYNTVLEDLNKISRRKYQDSCLYELQNEIYERIGI